ncbi:dTDP-4-amino-4,6-dideoxygalactose transaminase [Rhodanobacter glycinis]|uniref:dTDP-4-amino-4,6-dideoxygalactose transaminase n=2 Tax=Rhodanobacter glycinis TaxID=582702 RepID=A0A1I4D469_9GAMM|nr:dTDP-4-amino-4,6-dideoxygalactose transaminase [Rhodanobacter glycinis]
MPSFTFVSTANAFVLRGAVPVFIDIRQDTLNIDETLIEQAITPRTKAICVVHYAGVACEMDVILDVARRHGLVVVEDAAQGIMSSYHGRALGTLGELGAFSFHETKNIISGEGGALLCRDNTYCERAEIIREKGTNRSRFFRGQVDKYTWVDVGSSYLPGEITAAFLAGQIEEADSITAARLQLWNTYHSFFATFEGNGKLRRPIIPPGCVHNAHMYYLLLNSVDERGRFIEQMKALGVQTVFHYIPLHSAPAGRAHGRVSGSMEVSDSLSERLVRLPLWVGLEEHMPHILDAASKCLV